MNRLVVLSLAFVLIPGCPKSPSPHPIPWFTEPPTQQDARIQAWREIMLAEQEWVDLLTGTASPTGLGANSHEAQMRLTQEILGRFDRAYNLLEAYTQRASEDSLARGKFRLALYSDLRLRFGTR